ncbi:lysophospholipid acyltransferase family protein [Desulfovibrio aminophilus]|nr:lysophospholipid acyltransferase family protein [Desulfovibrio aminophilus]MCM0754380.1 lysophospholipid acyltransferase family protein [Desulfovibrio aminophilus]
MAAFSIADLAPVTAGLYKLWAHTIRYDHAGEWDPITASRMEGKACVLALWHNELFALTAFGYIMKMPAVTLVSQSKDGEIIARMLERMGHVTARGSSTRGGVKALIKAARVMRKENRHGVLTVDGPKGPRHVPKPGALLLSRLSGNLIFPIRAFPERKVVFQRSWDKFEIPYPFTRCQIRVGEPIQAPDEEMDEAALNREAERLGRIMRGITPR